MHYVERLPSPALRPWVSKLWALRDAPSHTRERILPSGTLELVINLHEDELRIYGANDESPCQRLSGALVSGAYDRAFTIDTREHASVVGVHFEPGGAGAFLPMPAGLLRNAHVELEALWGPEARRLRERLCAAPSSARCFDILDSALRDRLASRWAPHASIPLALQELERGARVAAVVSRAGLSHRSFVAAFTAAVGMTPKAFARVRRFQRVLEQARHCSRPDWPALAVAKGYFDQSHLIREFVALAGLSPSQMAKLGAVAVKEFHVALPASGR